MATLTEDYVSLETAKLLKEKGFDEPIQHFYKYDSEELYRGTVFTNTQIGDKFYNVPTHQMAMKWLREIHNIAINIGWGEIFEDKFQWWCIILNYKDGSILRDSEYYATYEEAVEKAIKYTLEKLI